MEVIMKGVQLHGIITYTEYLKVAITTPEGGSRIPISEDLSSQITHTDQ